MYCNSVNSASLGAMAQLLLHLRCQVRIQASGPKFDSVTLLRQLQKEPYFTTIKKAASYLNDALRSMTLFKSCFATSLIDIYRLRNSCFCCYSEQLMCTFYLSQIVFCLPSKFWPGLVKTINFSRYVGWLLCFRFQDLKLKQIVQLAFNQSRLQHQYLSLAPLPTRLSSMSMLIHLFEDSFELFSPGMGVLQHKMLNLLS